MERNFILVRYDTASVIDGVDLCKQIETIPNVTHAVLVRKGSKFADETYVGEYYTTRPAAEKMV